MGGSDEIKETEYEKELAKVYQEQWSYYQDSIVPVENQVIEDAKSSNDENVYQGIGDDANLGYQRSLAQASETTAENMAASGVDPSSGKFKGVISSLSDIESSVSADAKSRAQVAGQERHIDKMSNIMAMGQGEAQQAVSSLSDIAVNSQRKAVNDASISAQNKSNTLGAIGAVGGAMASGYSNSSGGMWSDGGGESLGAVNSNPFARGA